MEKLFVSLEDFLENILSHDPYLSATNSKNNETQLLSINEFSDIFKVLYYKPISLSDFFNNKTILTRGRKKKCIQSMPNTMAMQPAATAMASDSVSESKKKGRKKKTTKLLDHKDSTKVDREKQIQNDFRMNHRDQIIEKLYHDIYLNARETNTLFFRSYLEYKVKIDYWTYKDIFIHKFDKHCSKGHDFFKNLCVLSNIDDTNINSTCNFDFALSTQRNDASKRIIRNIFYKELLEYTNTTTSLFDKKPLLTAWREVFQEFRLDDRYFSPSVLNQYLKKNPLHFFFQQYQPKASILNPYTVYWILEFFFPKILKKTETIYSPVMSWGAYALAFCHTLHWKTLFSTDVMPSVVLKTGMLAEHYNKSNKVCDFYCERSEKLIVPKYVDNVDLVFFCPPYYKMEMYHENQQDQSTNVFKDYKDWLLGYWKQTILNCHQYLIKGGILSFILGNYVDYESKISYNLMEDCNQIIDGMGLWIRLGQIELVNRTSPLRKIAKTRSEFLFVYRKI
jgi:hypothetical protein